MDLTLSPEQELLVDTARSFVERTAHRASDPTEDPATSLDWPAMAELGWAGLAIAEEYGGAGQGLLEVALLSEALGRAPVPSPLVTTTVAAVAIAEAGDDAQRADWLPGLASGERLATLALLEAGAADEWDDPSPLGATKVLVPWAADADLTVVSADDGLHVVEAAEGPAPRRHDDIAADPVFELDLTGVRSQRLAGDGAAALARALDVAAVLRLAEAVGTAERVLEMTVQHACDRQQFGRPIGSFQAVAHRCVDMRTDLDACRALARWAAWALDRPEPADLAVGTAKAYGNDALRRFFGHAHQVHGAIGFSTEHELHRYTRRAKAFELSFGSTARHLERVATAMGL